MVDAYYVQIEDDPKCIAGEDCFLFTATSDIN